MVVADRFPLHTAVFGLGPRRRGTEETGNRLVHMLEVPMRAWMQGVLVVTLSVILLFGSRPTSAETSWEGFTHPTFGFSISIPPGWTTLSLNDSKIPLIITGPSAAGVPDAPMMVAVFTGTAPLSSRPEDLLTASDEALQKQGSDYRVLRVDRTTIQGRPTNVIYLTARSKAGNDLYGIAMFTVAKPRFWAVIGFTSLQSKELASEAQLQQSILLTFRLK